MSRTAVTDENIIAVKNLFKEDRYITYGEIEATLKIWWTIAQTIIKDHLHLTKRCRRWIPRQLMPEQKEKREQWCPYMLQRFRGGKTEDIYNIVTGDESWIYNHDPGAKQ